MTACMLACCFRLPCCPSHTRRRVAVCAFVKEVALLEAQSDAHADAYAALQSELRARGEEADMATASLAAEIGRLRGLILQVKGDCQCPPRCTHAVHLTYSESPPRHHSIRQYADAPSCCTVRVLPWYRPQVLLPT